MRNTLAGQTEEEKRLSEILDRRLAGESFGSREEMLSCVVPEAALEAKDRELQDYDQKAATNKAGLEQAVKEAEGKVRIDLDMLQKENEKRSLEVREIRNKAENIRFRKESNSEKLEGMKSQKEPLENARREYAVCERLYNLVKGTTGNGKITLEQYIQAAGFDGIIKAANRRLLPMSENQYELYRQEDSLGKRVNTFLDLEVLDNYTGRRRPVGNLSGGESFKASLSLALGLSDTVSSKLGGIQMDALFVDEGFGTLDRKSIESAMDILLHLSGSNKLVGVISHREELIENIPQQIRVSKKKEGSGISIETGV